MILKQIASLYRAIDAIMRHPVNQGHFNQSFLRYMRFQVGRRLLAADIIYNWISDCKVIIDRGDSCLSGLFYVGLPDFKEMSYLLHVIRPGDRFWDIGANVGLYTILAGVGRGASVTSFEPVPASSERLVRNVQLHFGNYSCIELMNIAIGETDTHVTITTNEGQMNHVTAKCDKGSQQKDVQCRPLDVFLQPGEEPTVMKIDVEGYETAVIRGAKETLKSPVLHTIIIELCGHGRRYGYDEMQLLNEIMGYGFRPYEYKPQSRVLRHVTAHSDGNLILIRDIERVRKVLKDSIPFKIYGRTF